MPAALPENITQAREQAQSLATGAGQLASEQFTIGDTLKQKALDAYNANQDIIKPLDVATTDYIQAPSEARAKYVDPESESYVFNPFQAENLVSQYVSQQAIPMLGLSSILGQRFGRVDDIIGAGTRAFQAQTAAEQGRAQQAQGLYQDLLSEYLATEELDIARQKLKDGEGGIPGTTGTYQEGEIFVGDDGNIYIYQNGRLNLYDLGAKQEPSLSFQVGGPTLDLERARGGLTF